MNLDHLKYFSLAAETLHTGRAGKMAHVSQSTICHGIRKLEKELGQKLFENQGKRIVLTELGEKFALRARQLLRDAESMKQDFLSSERPLQGLVRVAAVHGVSDHLLARALGPLQKAHPELAFEVFSLRSAQVAEGIVQKSYDLGFCFSPTSHPEIQRIQDWPTPLKIGVRKNHPLLKMKKNAALKSIVHFPSASPKAFAGIEVCERHPALIKAQILNEPTLIFDSYEVAAAYMKASDAWCFMPDLLIETLGLALLDLPGITAKAQLSLMAPRGRTLPAKLLESLLSLLTRREASL